MGKLRFFRNRSHPDSTETDTSNGTRSDVTGEQLILPKDLFDEPAYLDHNPDVRVAVEAGTMTAYEHYVRYGHKEEARGMRQRSLPSQIPSLSIRAYQKNALIDRLIDTEIEKRALLEAWERQLPFVENIDFDMLCETVADEVLPPLDQTNCDESQLDSDQLFWRSNGYLVKPNFIPHDLIDAYCAIRSRHPSTGGWSCPVPYMHIPEIRAISLYPPLADLLTRLIGEEMGLHLNLTGWVSTDRNWHQDDYLNPPYINSWYAATWIALDDIHPDSGPFEFVPGSHKWPLMKSHKVRLFLTAEERKSIGWAFLAERFVNKIAEKEISDRGSKTEKFIAKKGDLLVWHGRLMHRGSYANAPGMERKTLISHYSGLSHRVDMPVVARTAEGKPYFNLPHPIDFNPYAQTPN